MSHCSRESRLSENADFLRFFCCIRFKLFHLQILIEIGTYLRNKEFSAGRIKFKGKLTKEQNIVLTVGFADRFYI